MASPVKPHKVILLFFVILALAAISLNLEKILQPHSKIKWVAPLSEKIEIKETVRLCRLDNGPCLATWGENSWAELEITPRPIAVEKKMQIILKVSKNVNPIAVDFEGVNLNMGYLRPSFVKIQDGIFTAQIQLPMCEEKTMEWKLTVILDDATASTNRSGLVFYFSTQF